MKINDLTFEVRDSYDKLKYNWTLTSRFNKIKQDLSSGSDLELLCDEYRSLVQLLIGHNIKNDPEIENLKNETLQSLMVAGGASYLSEDVFINQ